MTPENELTKDLVSNEKLALELRAMRSEIKYWIVASVVGSQALSHVALPDAVGLAGAAALVGWVLFKAFIIR